MRKQYLYKSNSLDVFLMELGRGENHNLPYSEHMKMLIIPIGDRPNIEWYGARKLRTAKTDEKLLYVVFKNEK